MIGLVVVGHGNLPLSLLEAMERVVGPQQSTAAVCIGPEDDMEQRRADILAAVRACDSGDGVIILTDMFGGTPSNLAISITGDLNVEVLTGANLPMLIKLASSRKKPLNEALTEASDAAQKYITSASQLLAFKPVKKQ